MAAAKGNNYNIKRKINPQHSKEDIKKIISDLLDWAANSDGIYLASYIYEKYKKNKSYFHSLAQNHPEVNDAIAQAKSLIAGKLHNHCWMGDRNSSFGEKILPMYCDEYKKETERKARLSQAVTGESNLSLSDVVKMIQSGELIRLLSQQEKKPIDDD